MNDKTIVKDLAARIAAALAPHASEMEVTMEQRPEYKDVAVTLSRKGPRDGRDHRETFTRWGDVEAKVAAFAAGALADWGVQDKGDHSLHSSSLGSGTFQ